jgi:hypothetical protein
MRLTVGTGGVGGGPISTSPLGRITCVPGPEPDSKAWSRVGSSIRGSSGASEGVVAVGAAGLAIGNGTGNPRVSQRNPYPYPWIPIPATTGMGFGG